MNDKFSMKTVFIILMVVVMIFPIVTAVKIAEFERDKKNIARVQQENLEKNGVISPEIDETLSNETENVFAKTNEVLYQGEVVHLFTHALLAESEKAFREDNSMRIHYDRDCLLTSEFEKILENLYSNDYVLVDVHKTYEIVDGVAKKIPFMFPEGKKPLILSFDDVVYDPKKQNQGMIDRIVIKNGKIAGEIFETGEVAFDNEFIGILESFIKENQDFSHENAKGIICVTGYCGVLGYRTQDGSPNQQSEIVKAKKVVNLLKKNGWVFASHSFCHGHMKSQSVEKFADDTKKWKNQVESVVGETNLFAYPYGEWEIEKDGETSDKHKILVENGFEVFFGVGVNPFYSHLPYNSNEKFLFMDRCPMDGISLRLGHETIKKYFDPEFVYNHEIRFIPFD